MSALKVILLSQEETEAAICDRLENLMQSYPNCEIKILDRKIRIIGYQQGDCIKLYVIFKTREELEFWYEFSVNSNSILREKVQSWFQILISSSSPVPISMICLLNYYQSFGMQIIIPFSSPP